MIQKLDTFGSIITTDPSSGETINVVRQEIVMEMFKKINEIIEAVNRLEPHPIGDNCKICGANHKDTTGFSTHAN